MLAIMCPTQLCDIPARTVRILPTNMQDMDKMKGEHRVVFITVLRSDITAHVRSVDTL